MTEPYLQYTEPFSHYTTLASLSTSSILLTPLPRLADLLKVKLPLAQSYISQVSHAIAPATTRLDEIYDHEQNIGPSRIPLDEPIVDDFVISRKGKERAREKWISTGDVGLDKALGGGIRRGCLYEISGESASGKSHLSLHLALAVQLPSLSSSPGGSLVLTSERDLSTDRLVQLGQHLLVTHESSEDTTERSARNLLDNILTNRIADVEALEHALNYAVPAILDSRLGDVNEKNGQLPIRLIILDSITALFRGSSNANQPPSAHNAISLAERSKHLCVIADILKSLAVKYDLTVLVINQVSDVFQRLPPIINPLPSFSQQPTSSFSQTAIFTGLTNSQQPNEEAAMLYKTQSRWFSGENDQLKKEAALGIVWANAVNVRIMLSRTGRRRLMDQVELTSHKRKRLNSQGEEADKPGYAPRMEEINDIKQTLIRRFHVVFSPFSAPSTIDFVVTSSGVHSLTETYKKIDTTETVIKRKIKEEKERELEKEDEEFIPRDEIGIDHQYGMNRTMEDEQTKVTEEWDEVFDDFGELPDEFWQGKYDLGVIDFEAPERKSDQLLQNDRRGADQHQSIEHKAFISDDDDDLFSSLGDIMDGNEDQSGARLDSAKSASISELETNQEDVANGI
ncbi:uncharacterized protein I206_100842 [Kwoniella pini CBS 10737]|uniref:RecA family profile 1 domain-containing protein n=1 Tax=Kwoniella pini CBS 10737 TaxID=1296096 RepID=A0A1B9ICI5_9TREE|nr:uncharacterized protein I206_00484 [Kwoniella pini CBS 10737]OCF53183.1 hypothetical protein I206_00484 [Kwoniella pini CBS 10737]